MSKQFNLVHDKVIEVKTVIVHTFTVSDVEDPDLYAAEPLLKWQDSEQGKWVMEHAVDQPIWHRKSHTFLNWGYEYFITARLIDKDYTFWVLKYGTDK